MQQLHTKSEEISTKNNLSKLSDTYYWEAYKLFKMWGAELK